jgi:hypothetical protein
VTHQLPTRRQKIVGTDLDGNTLELIHSIAKKLYRCPGCRESIAIGAEHVLVRIAPPGEVPYHQHWHSECARAIMRELKNAARKPL